MFLKKNLTIFKNSFPSPNSQGQITDIKHPLSSKNLTSIPYNTTEAGIALINKIKSQETEKSSNKLQMIRDVLIREIKETDQIKKNVEEFREYINNVINLNLNFFNQKIFKGKENLCVVIKKSVLKDSVENLQNNLEDDNHTEYIAIETNIAIKNNKIENFENQENSNDTEENVNNLRKSDIIKKNYKYKI